jgi:hypothetical protein
VKWSLDIRRLFIDQFTPGDLRHLASLMESETPARKARRNLSPEAAEELASILVSGGKPTIGWWRRHGT